MLLDEVSLPPDPTAGTAPNLGPAVSNSSFDDAANNIAQRGMSAFGAAMASGATEMTVSPPVRGPEPADRPARTAVGVAVQANGASIILALAALQLQLEEKLSALKDERLNSDERRQEIAEYEDLKEKVGAVLEAAVKFLTTAAEEEALEKKTQSFAAMLASSGTSGASSLPTWGCPSVPSAFASRWE